MAIEKEELGIVAGLQDRVIQTYEGVVFMDFSKALLDTQGFGNYEPLKVEGMAFLCSLLSGSFFSCETHICLFAVCWLFHLDLPTFYLAYQVKAGGESGKIHSDVRKRWEQGDPEIVEGMKVFAKYTDEAKVAVGQRDFKTLGPLMDMNFNQRKKLYSEKVIGGENLKMIQLAR